MRYKYERNVALSLFEEQLIGPDFEQYLHALCFRKAEAEKEMKEISERIMIGLTQSDGTRWRSRLRHCAASRKVAGSIPYGHWIPATLLAWSRLSL
jgi:hypothetical protein